MSPSPERSLVPFVFSDPLGRRWPRLRRVLVVSAVVAFVCVVVFVRALFVVPQLSLPHSLRHIQGQLKAIQQQNPAATSPAPIPLWEKFSATRKQAKSAAPTAPAVTLPKRNAAGEIRLGFYRNGDAYSYASLEQHAAQLTHLSPEWIAVVNGLGDIQIDPDKRVVKLAEAKGLAVFPRLTNLAGDTWQPQAIENLANAPGARQERFFANVLAALREAKAAGVVIDWQQLDPAYTAETAALLGRLADVLHQDGREIWLCVNPGEADGFDRCAGDGREDRSLRRLALR